MKRSLAAVGFALLVVCACTQRKDNGLDEVQSLHRGELAAIATYDQAIEKIERADARATLGRLRDEHRAAADSLKARVVALAGTPATEAGPWGQWTKLVTGASGALGEDAMLGTLKAGEKHGIDEYEDALADAEVDAATKELARSLLQKQRDHVAALEALSAASQ
jgi:hypothetical protein